MADSQRPDSTPLSGELSHASRDLLAAAEREAGDIVAAARADVQRTVTKAQQELQALSAQVEATIELLDGSTAGPFFPGMTGRQATSRLLRDARAGLDALSGEPRAGDEWTAPVLSPLEVESFRLPPLPPRAAARRVRFSARAAAQAAAAVAIGAVALALVGAWALGKRSLDAGAAPPPAHALASASPAAVHEQTEPTGMTGRGGASSKTPTPPPASAPADEPRAETPAPAVLPAPAIRSAGAGTAAPGGRAGAEPAAASPTPPAVRQELVSSAERWLDAYYVQDPARLAALSTSSVTISDERKPEERLPAGLTGVRRTVVDPNVQVFGTDAIITARVIERADVPGARVSAGFVSQMWTRRSGSWQVTDVRIVSAAAVERAFKR